VDAEVDGLVAGMGVENVGYPGTGDDDAGMALTGGQYAQAASLQMEGSGVAPPRERVQDDGDVEFGALQALAVLTLIIAVAAGAVCARAWRIWPA
jgi:hypothetical protein